MSSVAALLAIVIYSVSSGPDEKEYIDTIQKERKKKDDFMKTADDSPFSEARDSFAGLKYFEPDRKYRVRAELQPIKEKRIFSLPTSTGEENKYLEYAWAEFEIDGKKSKLLLLEVMAMGPTRGTLFLAFADETSARETYGAGRYLELKKMPGAGSIVLDFNKAYNPYCAYVDRYSCPFPPKENILTLRIPAGEKSYH